MRDILFRGKEKVGGKWVYGLLNDLHTIGEKSYEIESFNPITGEVTQSPVITETIGQFTGLYDKYGRRIFEGDLIESKLPHSYSCQAEIRFGEFAWNKEEGEDGEQCIGFYFHIDNVEPCPFSSGFNNVEYTVIGNIHDL